MNQRVPSRLPQLAKEAECGAPVLEAAIAHLECKVVSRMDSGDHWVIYAEVRSRLCRSLGHLCRGEEAISTAGGTIQAGLLFSQWKRTPIAATALLRRCFAATSASPTQRRPCTGAKWPTTTDASRLTQAI